jgi:hypothetical protein
MQPPRDLETAHLRIAGDPISTPPRAQEFISFLVAFFPADHASEHPRIGRTGPAGLGTALAWSQASLIEGGGADALFPASK